ncbi:FG-GAP repeat protein [Nostoc flagelliforme FACHB-838]|uniref:FG-GAP repeat protein n=1 Tax=Nostoc flagelliforme FACHB-838 TaxID=2692904 RepID=A0ABR8DZL2_9NOSO|nr:FG-GAP repeat protein [Nostoc flagelliforme]MBD2533715.1 FG-GAP repeat protein [Nostoc flagelliforme FACHB-838]
MANSFFNLSSLNGTNGFIINGIAANDESGTSVSNAGDINNDGIDDLIIGANYSGQNYVVFGGKNLGSGGILNLSSLNGTNGFFINGFAEGGYLVSNAGDINNDGIDDLVIGAYNADPNGNSDAGQSYIVFGGKNLGSGGSFNLSSLNGTNGFIINGIAENDRLGISISNAGDINNDGIDDLIIGARGADPNGKSNAGQSYVVFGGTNIANSNSFGYRTGTPGPDTFFGTPNNNINGLILEDTLTGNGGQDTFVFRLNDGNNITDFGGIGKGSKPSAEVIANADILQFTGSGLTAQNLRLTQNGNNLEVTFENAGSTKVTLQNFQLENLDNLKAFGNILFDGQTSITDSFDVFNANSTQNTIFNKNTVTFLNDLNNNVNGFDNSDDVINGQGGDDIIDGKSGNDLLRGGTGNDTLIGGALNDTLESGAGNNSLVGGTGDDQLNANSSTGNNTLNGGAGKDFLSIDYSTGDNLLNGDDGNDSLRVVFSDDVGKNTLNGGNGDDLLFLTLYPSASKTTPFDLATQAVDGGKGNDLLSVDYKYATKGITTTFNVTTNIGSITAGTNQVSNYKNIERLNISGTAYDDNIVGNNGNDTLYGEGGNNTIIGGAGNDYLNTYDSGGDNLLSGGDGNDSLDASADYIGNRSGNNTLNGGAGDDYLLAEFSIGNNLLSGDDGNDYLSVSGSVNDYGYYTASGNNTLNGGAGNDTLLSAYTTGDNLLNGGDGNDSFYVGSAPASGLVTQTVDGGKGDDFLSIDYSNATEGIATTFNATTNIGSITAGTNQVSYKNIEQLNISGTAYDDNIVGNSGNDTLSTGFGGNDTIDGGIGDDLLSVAFRDATEGIATTFNATTNIGSITTGANLVSYKNIERLNISGTAYDDNIVGNNGNDTLSGGTSGSDTIDGGIGDDLLSFDYYDATKGITSTFNATTNIGSITAGTNLVSYKNIERLNISGTSYDDNILGSNGNDTLSGGYGGNDILTGGNGNDTFVFNSFGQNVDRLDDFDVTHDIIQLAAYIYFVGEIGSLQKSQFTIGASAKTVDQRFIYDFSTGGLFFDRDGSASGFTQEKFAQLSAGLSLTENNFVVV